MSLLSFRQPLHSTLAAERSASPAAHTTELATSLARDINAIRGRVHAVVRRPVYLLESRCPGWQYL